MSDWDFLHEMHDRGYSSDDIADAAACGYAPWEANYIDRQWAEEQLKGEPEEDAASVQAARSREGFPFSILEQIAIFQDLVECAKRHYQNTGRYLQVWGELGEIYAEIKFGLRRNATHAPGSDGTIHGQRVEVKTISPEKTGNYVLVKSEGNFEKLLIVRIDQDFQFQSKILDRAELSGGAGKYLKGYLKSD